VPHYLVILLCHINLPSLILLVAEFLRRLRSVPETEGRRNVTETALNRSRPALPWQLAFWQSSTIILSSVGRAVDTVDVAGQVMVTPVSCARHVADFGGFCHMSLAFALILSYRRGSLIDAIPA